MNNSAQTTILTIGKICDDWGGQEREKKVRKEEGGKGKEGEKQKNTFMIRETVEVVFSD